MAIPPCRETNCTSTTQYYPLPAVQPSLIAKAAILKTGRKLFRTQISNGKLSQYPD
jgi:hypothetical protein